MSQLRIYLDDYWAWLSAKPNWKDMSVNDIKNKYVDSVYADIRYDQLFISIRDGANTLIEKVNESHFLSNEHTKLLLEAILVDYLWEDIIDDCTSHLEALARQQLFIAGIEHWSYHVRCLCVEKAILFPFENLEAILTQVITKDINNDVKRFALLALSNIETERAIKFAMNFIQTDFKDEYIIIASIDIIYKFNPQLLRAYVDSLKYHFSPYVRKRIEEITNQF